MARKLPFVYPQVTGAAYRDTHLGIDYSLEADMRRRPLIASFIVVSLLPLMPVGLAAAAPGDDTSVTVGNADATQSIVIQGQATSRASVAASTPDLETLAKTKGESLETLERRFRDQDAFDSLASELGELPSYVQAGYAADGNDAEVWMRFTTRPDDAVLAKIKSTLSYKVRVEYGSRLGWDALNETMEHLFMLTNSQPGVTDTTAGIDPGSDQIVIEYTSLPTLGASTVANAVLKAARTDATLAKRLDAAQVTFTRSGDAPSSRAEATVRGGYSLSTDTVAGDCTSGIPMIKDGQRGISTAMHCSNSLRYGGVNDTGIIQYRNAASTTSSGANIDLQWHSTLSGSSTSASFYSSAGLVRSIDAASNAVVGDYVCHYGMGTGYGCEYVYQLAVCYTPDDLTFCGLAALESWITDGGDSGGPWFTNYTVRGVHSGRAVLNGTLRSVYTPQTRIAENLAGSVLTS